MLVLTRRIGQRILVPHCNLVLTVVGIKGRNVQLGFTAPADVAVHREEIVGKADDATRPRCGNRVCARSGRSFSRLEGGRG